MGQQKNLIRINCWIEFESYLAKLLLIAVQPKTQFAVIFGNNWHQ